MTSLHVRSVEEKVQSVVETSTLCPPIFESTVCFMCWPLNSVILLKPNVETATGRAHIVSVAFSVLLSGVRTALTFIMVSDSTKSTECWRSMTLRRKTSLTF